MLLSIGGAHTPLKAVLYNVSKAPVSTKAQTTEQKKNERENTTNPENGILNIFPSINQIR